jgi:AraC-like DNA-binding protein
MAIEPDVPTVARVIVHRIIAGLEFLGIDPAPVLARCGLAPDTATTLPERVPHALIGDLFVAARELTGERALGVRLAELVEPEFYDVFGYVVKASATLAEALARTERYLRLLGDGFRFSLHREGPHALLLCESAYPALTPPEAVEVMLGSVAVIARYVTGQNLLPREVRFAHDPPPDLAHHARVFRGPIIFRSAHDGILFEPSLLELPIQSGDRRLCRLLERQADQILETLPETGRYARRVRELIAAELAAGRATAARIAKRLAMHPRTLHRRLREEDTTLRKLLDSMRCDLAARHLATSQLTIAEIADRLGFSDPTAFNKAFRRWTGDSPRAFPRRAQLRGTSTAA